MMRSLRNNRLSSVIGGDSPNGPGDTSEVGTENSSFSALATKKRSSSESAKEKRRTLGERSLASLTSGVADTRWCSR